MTATARVVNALADLIDVLSGFAFKSDQFGDEGDLPLVRIRDVKKGYSDTYYTGNFEERYVIQNGDLLIGMDGEFNRERWSGGRALLNQRVCKVTADGKKLDDQYLYHFLPAALKAIEDRTPFATVKHLSAKDIRSIEIPLPPLDEQRRIAAILDKADALRRQRRRALALLDGLTQSRYSADFSCENHMMTLGEVLEEIDSGWSPTCLDQAATDGEPGALKLSAVTQGYFKPFENKAFPPNVIPRARDEVKQGDILLCRKNTRDLVGASTYVWETPPHRFLSDLMFRLRSRPVVIDPIYLQATVSTPKVRHAISALSAGSAGSMPNISKSKLREILIPVPDVARQKQFGDFVRGIYKHRQQQVGSFAMLDAQFASLQHRAFTGQL